MSERAYCDRRASELLDQLRRTGDPAFRDAVVEEMRPLVRSIAAKFAGKEPLEDLESEGFIGLIRAVDRFVPERGARFSTFASHLVAGQIRHYLRDRGHLIRQPAWLQELNTRVLRISAQLEQRLQRPPSAAEIAEAANLTEEGVEELLAARRAAQIVRMETPSEEGEEFLEVDPEKFQSRQYVTLELPIEDRIVLENALGRLKDLERKVLSYFFYDGFNQSEIARRLGISCNYTGYVLRNGLKHMRERLPEESGGDRGRGASEGGIVDRQTGIYCREQFERRLLEEIQRARHFERYVSVLSLRLPEGCRDEEMTRAAELLRRSVRRLDIVARTGDREFGVILPNTGTVAGQVAMRLAESLYPVVQQPIRAAAATYPDSGRNADQLLRALDGTLGPEDGERAGMMPPLTRRAAAARA
ncbi:MAG: sigma-70 family RNA polymerase sigma factor [Armatimonadota bacterium]